MIGSTPWPNVLADLTAKRDALNGVIDTIRTNFVNADNPNEMPESPAPARNGRKVKRSRQLPGSARKKRIEKRQTDRQTDRAKGGPARSAEPP